VRLEAIRILAPLVILGFLSSRIWHADDWLSTAGFVVPDLGGDWRQPLYLPPLPETLAFLLGGVLVGSGLCVSLGWRTRPAAAIFTVCLLYVALADRLAAFTVSKLAPVIGLALLASPAGARFGVDAWRARRRDPSRVMPTRASGGTIRFFQLLVPVFYFSSGVCKAKGDWLDHPLVLWTHLHDSYQTWFSHFLGNQLPSWSWTPLQGAVLAFEVLAPLWFALRWTRPVALAFGLAMHLMIGLMFGPVIWFSLLMMALLVAGYAPIAWLERAAARLPPS
jgi:uncharacterized membrane protein YphA (DoxX/SURF4 family)